MDSFKDRIWYWLQDHIVEVYVIMVLTAIAFGVNWMAYEQMRANSGIFIDPRALSAEPPTATPQMRSF